MWLGDPNTPDEREARADLWAILGAAFFAVPMIAVAAWYLIWVAVRDNAGSRLEAGWWVCLAYALAGALATFWGPIYGILAVFVAGLLALVYVGVKGHKRRRDQVSTDGSS